MLSETPKWLLSIAGYAAGWGITREKSGQCLEFGRWEKYVSHSWLTQTGPD
jgi:hypothetical protein